MKALTFGRNCLQIRVVFHPEPQAETIDANWTIRVEKGPVGYQTSDGVIHQP